MDSGQQWSELALIGHQDKQIDNSCIAGNGPRTASLAEPRHLDDRQPADPVSVPGHHPACDYAPLTSGGPGSSTVARTRAFACGEPCGPDRQSRDRGVGQVRAIRSVRIAWRMAQRRAVCIAAEGRPCPAPWAFLSVTVTPGNQDWPTAPRALASMAQNPKGQALVLMFAGLADDELAGRLELHRCYGR